MLLKEVPGMLPVLENSDLSLSKLWHKRVERILPVQLTALILKTLRDTPDSRIALEVQFAVKQVGYAIELGHIKDALIKSYQPPSRDQMLISHLIHGLHRLTYERRRAVLFSLESRLPLSQVEALSRQCVARIRKQLSPTAKEIVDTAIISMQTSHLFWEPAGSQHVPLTCLEQHVYEAFGMTSYQLNKRYMGLIFDDPENIKIA